MPEAGNRRVFFALWPDTTTASRLDQTGRQLQSRCGGRQVQRDLLHMTLLFLGNIPAARIESLRKAAARVTGETFALQFDRWDCWHHKQLAWAGCSEPPPPLLTLTRQLAERLSEEGLPIELRDFVAHVTLLRKARTVPLPEFEAFEWSVKEFVLAESKLLSHGAQYTLIGRWPLAQGQN